MKCESFSPFSTTMQANLDIRSRILEFRRSQQSFSGFGSLIRSGVAAEIECLVQMILRGCTQLGQRFLHGVGTEDCVGFHPSDSFRFHPNGNRSGHL
jgi:hypothetical protein